MVDERSSAAGVCWQLVVVVACVWRRSVVVTSATAWVVTIAVPLRTTMTPQVHDDDTDGGDDVDLAPNVPATA